MAVDTPAPSPIDTSSASAAEERPTGLAAAALLAAGLGAFILGLLTTLAEASTGVADGLNFKDRVGPLSGKTIIAVAVFFGAWGVLSALLQRRNPALKLVFVVTGVLLALGFLMTFPTFFQAFE
jgi:hypothetical protein